jgi:hypothetical protein
MMSEAKLSAILVSALTGVGLTLVLASAFRSVATALTISVPVALVMGAVLALFATDEIRKGDDKSPKGK